MPVVTRRELLEAGVHFGHQTRRWNPKMSRFLYGERSGIYIIDLEKSLQGLEETYEFVRNLGRRDGIVLFIGTKKQAQEVVATYATSVGMPFVNNRWLGGMLTNFTTISKRLGRMRELLRWREPAPWTTCRRRKRSACAASARSWSATLRHPGPRASSRRRVHHRHEEGAHRGHRGAQARHPGHPGRRPTATPTRSTSSSPATTTPSARSRSPPVISERPRGSRHGQGSPGGADHG